MFNKIKPCKIKIERATMSFHVISICDPDQLTFFDLVKCKRASAGKVKFSRDKFATDLFRSGRATKPKNPYFVTKIQSSRRNQLNL